MQMPPLIFRCRLEAPFHALEIRRAREAQLDECLRLGMDEALAWDLAAILDELATNVRTHSEATWMDWSILSDAEEGLFILHFVDNGARFDPASHPLPPVGDGTQGRMGLAMTRRLARSMRYRREAGSLNTLDVKLGPQPRVATP